MKPVHALLVGAVIALSGVVANAQDNVKPAAPANVAAPTPLPCSHGAKESTVYAILLRGNRAGYETSCRLSDGSREVLFAFNDRGRGPSTRTHVRLDSSGIPISIETAGNDYFKNQIEEKFTLGKGTASWKNKVEQGSAKASHAYYVSYSGPPEDGTWLARALLSAPNHRLGLLPAGEARIKTLDTAHVEAGGQSRSLQLEAITGLGFQPSYVWLEEGTDRYAFVSPWFTVVPEGWEKAAAQLQEVQDKRSRADRAEAAKRLREVPATPIVFVGGRVFDSTTATMHPGFSVVVIGNHIASVGPDGAVPIPPAARTIDVHGKTILPGLWDMHSHPSPEDGPLHLSNGITSIRDMAAEPDHIGEFAPWDTGEAIGPRVVFAGIIDGPGPYQGPTSTLVANEAEALAAVRKIAAANFAQVKIYSSVKPELVTPIAREAHTLGLRVSGHIPAFMTAEQAVRAGYDEIQHMNFLFLNFLFDKVQDTRTPDRFIAVAEHGADLDLASDKVKQFVALLHDRGIVSDPTLGAFEELFVARPGQVDPVFAAVADKMPPQVRRGFFDGGLPVPAGSDARYHASFQKMLDMLALLDRSGIRIVAGTDNMAGFALAHEFELYVRAGLPPSRVLQMATLGAATIARRVDRLGSLEPGKLADLIVVDGDPASRISEIRNVTLVMKDGAIYDPLALRKELGILP